MLNSLLYLIINKMKRLGLIVAIIANLDSLALVILSASMSNVSEDGRLLGIMLGVLCWIATAYVIYLSVNEER
jgi:hypothetical protein